MFSLTADDYKRFVRLFMKFASHKSPLGGAQFFNSMDNDLITVLEKKLPTDDDVIVLLACLACNHASSLFQALLMVATEDRMLSTEILTRVEEHMQENPCFDFAELDLFLRPMSAEFKEKIIELNPNMQV